MGPHHRNTKGVIMESIEDAEETSMRAAESRKDLSTTQVRASIVEASSALSTDKPDSRALSP